MKTLARVALAASFAIAASAAESDWFVFPIPLLATNTPAFDLSRLNAKPAGKSGWIRVDGERFVDAAGREVRFFGGNLTAAACFPPPEEAPLIARGFARYGVNIVRLHFLDNQWTRGANALTLTPDSNDPARDGLHPNGIARLDAFIAALKAEGICANLNLHVGRTYPNCPKLTQNSKGVDNFMPEMIQGLKDYARALLTHVNPQTGLAYKDDPACPIIEISNEDSLVLNPWWTERLEGESAAELQRQFNAWLRKHYKDTAALRAAWGVDEGYLGTDLLPAGGPTKWNVERHGGSEHDVAAKDGVVTWTGRKRGGESWHMQVQSGRIALESGRRYEIQLKARSTTGTEIGLNVSQAGSPWDNLGLSTDCSLGAEWKTFTFFVQPAVVTTQSGARVVLSLKNQLGTVEIASIHCRPVSGGYLKPDQTLESGLALPRQGAPARVREDYLRFLADVEIAFATEIKRFLREELGCKALISHSQVLFGGPLGARREFIVSDFVDTHGYWHHPSFPNKPWDQHDWNIVNESQIKSWDGGTLGEMAMQRPVGKPYTISEYDIPAPSDYSAEKWPMLAAIAGFQHWSALYHYTYGHAAHDLEAVKITGFFNEAGHPAKIGFSPAGALMFRLGLVAPGRSLTTLNLPDASLFEQATRLNGQMWGAWRDLWAREAKASGALALRTRVGLRVGGPTSLAVSGTVPESLKSPHVADTDEWTWDTDAGLFILRAPAARVWSGFMRGRTMPAGDATLSVGDLDEPAPHATVVLVATDGKPLRESGQLLLTALRRADNVGMKFNDKRNTVNTDWGPGPARVLGLRAELTLPADTAWRVEALDAEGVVKARLAESTRTLKIDPAAGTIWWMLTRVHQ